DNVIVALVKSRNGEHSIFPLLDETELTSQLKATSSSQAINTLTAMAESYDQLSDDLERTVPEPVKQAKAKKAQRRRFVQFIHPNIIIIPLLLLSCAGCAVHQQTPVHNPYTERPELFDRPELSEQDLTNPYDLTPFIGTTGDSSFDQRVAEDFIEDTIQELEELRSDLQEQVTRLRSESQPDQTRIQSLEYRIGLLTATIENLRIEAENIPSSNQFITPTGQPDLSSGSPYQPGSIIPTPIPGGQAVPQELLSATRSILAEPFTQRSIQTLEAFNSGLTHRSGQFNGTVRSYDGDESHPDYSYLVSHSRVTPYDISVSIFADLTNGDYPLARQKVSGLLRIMQMESEAGFNGVVHFNYNTEDDSYVNPQAPLGNTAWTLKAIYAYILATGDRSILTGQNGQLIQNGMDFVMSQQVMIETDPRYGLFRAGLSSVETDGYGVMESTHNQYEHVVTEHLTDIHDLLNLAYQVTGNTLYQERRLLLDRQTLETLLVETDTTAYFLPNITPEGTPGSGVAIDDLTWAGSMVLTMDHLPLERRLELVRKLIQYVDDNFIVEHDPAMDNAQSIQLTDQYIAQRSQISSPAIVGVKFFDGFFEDEFIAGMDWDNPTVMSVQVEATLGYVHLLYQAASLTPDTAEQQRYIARIEFLMDNIQQFYEQHSTANGIPYSTRNIENIQTTLDATIASETYRAVLGIWNHPERMWSFIGIPQSSRTASQINTGLQDVSNQIAPAFPPEPVYVQPDNTFVFIANPFLESHIIYPSGRPGIQPSEELPFPTFTDQIQQDVRALLEYLSSFSVTGEDFSPAAVENWEG
ncbi:hypothetical protein KDK77_08515, partial [bacterium]|nr:hypothetical protein [bacterium]